MELSEDFKDVFTHAEIQAHASGRDRVDVTHLFSAILSLRTALPYIMLCVREQTFLKSLAVCQEKVLEETERMK